jgi:hypothetical protein
MLVPSSAEKIRERVDSGRRNSRTYQTKSSSRNYEERQVRKAKKTEPRELNPGHETPNHTRQPSHLQREGEPVFYIGYLLARRPQ